MKLIKGILFPIVFLFCLSLVSAQSYIDYTEGDDTLDLGLISYTDAPESWNIELGDYDEVGVGIYTSARAEPRMYAGYSGYLEVNGEKVWEHTGGSDMIRLSDGTEMSDYDTTNDRYFDITSYVHTGENTITYYHYTGDGLHGPRVLIRTAEGLSEGDDTLDLGLISYIEAPETWEIELSSFDKVGVGIYTSARAEPRMYAGYSGYLEVNGEKVWEHTGGSDKVRVLGEEISDYNKENNRYFDVTSYVSAGRNTITYYHYTGDGQHGPKVTVHGGTASLWGEEIEEGAVEEVEEAVVYCTDSDNSAGYPAYLAITGTCKDKTGSYTDFCDEKEEGFVKEYLCGFTADPIEEQECMAVTSHSCKAEGYAGCRGGKCVREGEAAGECPRGCLSEGNCISPGIRKKGMFCDTDNTMKEQKTKEEQCDNSYECRSNLCAGEICVSAGLIRRILNWLISVLG